MNDASTISLARLADDWELPAEVQVTLQKQIASWHERAKYNIDRIASFLGRRLSGESPFVAMLGSSSESHENTQEEGLVSPKLFNASIESLKTESGSRHFGMVNVQEVMKRFATDAMNRMAKEWGERSVPEDVFAAAMQSATIEFRSVSEEIADYGFKGLAFSEDRTPLMDAVWSELNESRVKHIRAYEGRRDLYRIRAVPVSLRQKTKPAGERDQRLYPVRAEWLAAKLLERGWGESDPSAHHGPDRNTVFKILRGEGVRNDVLKRLAKSLSAEIATVSVFDIPQN